MKKILNGADLNNQRIANLADPSANTDAANKQYVDNLARGLVIKNAVRAASTANINLAAPGATIDGVAMAVNDRFLAKDQATGAQKGIYVWNGAAVAATRADDADTGTELRPGTIVYVAEGTVNGDKSFAIVSDAAITIGTSDMTWSQFGGGSSYTAGNGIQISSNTISVLAAGGGGLIVNGSGVGIDTSVVTRKSAANIGNGAASVIAHVHNLGTKDVTVSLRESATDAGVDTDWVATDINTVTYTFPSAPTAAQYRSLVTG
jgi:hypothetical protein